MRSVTWNIVLKSINTFVLFILNQIRNVVPRKQVSYFILWLQFFGEFLLRIRFLCQFAISARKPKQINLAKLKIAFKGKFLLSLTSCTTCRSLCYNRNKWILYIEFHKHFPVWGSFQITFFQSIINIYFLNPFFLPQNSQERRVIFGQFTWTPPHGAPSPCACIFFVFFFC